jgi:phospholipase C
MLERLEKREINRRQLQPGPAPQARHRPELAPGTDVLPQIKHIVILMMENHSYDNYLGMLAGRGDGFPLGPDGLPLAVNTAGGTACPAHPLTSTTQVASDPTQTWRASHLQYGDGRNDGFAASVADTLHGADPGIPMGYWTERELPFYYGLARTFPLADHWFCSCLGPTFPNRRFLIAGTAHGLIDDLPWDLVDYPEAGTIFDTLSTHGISWTNYHSVSPLRVLLPRLLGGRGLVALRRLAQVGRWLPRVADTVRGNKSFTADLYPLGLARTILHLRSNDQFFKDADAGTLPAVSLVDPDFGQYSEENPQDIAKGESFAAEVINRVMHGPGWPNTVLIWLYDEHGGYYDHVPPPAAVAPGRRARAQLPARPAVLAADPAEAGAGQGLRAAGQHRLGALGLHSPRLPHPGRGGLPLRPARLRPEPDARPHLSAQADRTEVESASADSPGRGRGLAAGRAGPDVPGLRHSPGAARAEHALGHLDAVTGNRRSAGTTKESSRTVPGHRSVQSPVSSKTAAAAVGNAMLTGPGSAGPGSAGPGSGSTAEAAGPARLAVSSARPGLCAMSSAVR